MAHYAQVNNDNLVTQVLVISNENEEAGLEWLKKNFGETWIKTSYNTYGGKHLEGGEPLRKNFAGIGFTYDSERDAFIPPKEFNSWILNEEACLWEPPIPYPDSESMYVWDEENKSWI